VENAVKIARHATGRQAVIAFDHAYHGRTNLTMALTAKNMPYKNGFGPFAPGQAVGDKADMVALFGLTIGKIQDMAKDSADRRAHRMEDTKWLI